MIKGLVEEDICNFHTAYRWFGLFSYQSSLHFYIINCATNLDPMDLKSNHTASVLTDPPPISKSRLGVHSLQYSPPGATFSPALLLTIPRRKTGILDDVRSCTWLDAMKSSSPPHRKISKGVNNEFATSDADVAYRTWMVLLISSYLIFFWVFNINNF